VFKLVEENTQIPRIEYSILCDYEAALHKRHVECCLRTVHTNIDRKLIADQRNFRAKYL